jgi:E3 ubiquitin-protein ligase MYCBP2
MQKSCDKILKCGHACLGSAGEKQCMPCLEDECIAKMDGNMKPNVNKDEYCSICYCSSLGQEPCVQLGCRHIFHVDCLKKIVQNGYNGPRIVFNYIDCPDCKQRMSAKQCPSLDKEI